MTEYPTLTEVLTFHSVWDETANATVRCFCDTINPSTTNGVPDGGWMTPQQHHTHIAAAWRETCTIRTTEQLDTLPPSALIRDSQHEVWAQRNSGWDCLEEDGFRAPAPPTAVPLPALLIWHPRWETQP